MDLPSRTSAPPHVAFYFDFVDPYSFLASRRIPRICREAEVALTLEPVRADGVGGDEAARGRAIAGYLWRDIEEAASRLRLTIRRPMRWPFDSARLLEACLFIKDRSGQEAMAAMTESLWEAIWIRGEDPESRQTAIEAARSAAVPERVVDPALSNSRLPGLLEGSTRRARSRGVLSLPALQVDETTLCGLNEVFAAEPLLRRWRDRGEDAPGPTGASESKSGDEDPPVPDWTFSG